MSYRNLKEETLNKIKDIGKTIEDIEYGTIVDDTKIYTIDSVSDLDKLDFRYYAGYGTQEVSGNIVFKDGTWLDRAEYDGSEWWEYYKKPERYKGVINGT